MISLFICSVSIQDWKYKSLKGLNVFYSFCPLPIFHSPWTHAHMLAYTRTCACTHTHTHTRSTWSANFYKLWEHGQSHHYGVDGERSRHHRQWALSLLPRTELFIWWLSRSWGRTLCENSDTGPRKQGVMHFLWTYYFFSLNVSELSNCWKS